MGSVNTWSKKKRRKETKNRTLFFGTWHQFEKWPQRQTSYLLLFPFQISYAGKKARWVPIHVGRFVLINLQSLPGWPLPSCWWSSRRGWSALSSWNEFHKDGCEAKSATATLGGHISPSRPLSVNYCTKEIRHGSELCSQRTVIRVRKPDFLNRVLEFWKSSKFKPKFNSWKYPNSRQINALFRIFFLF